MAITISLANIATHRGPIVGLFRETLNPFYDDRRFEWLYCQCLYSLPRVCLAVNEKDGMIVGVAAAFMRRAYLKNQECSVWVLGDFCLDARYRSLGPALQLQRACLEVTQQDGGAFCYDFPSASMVAVYKRLGFSVTGKMLRLAKPLRVDRKVKDIMKNRAARRVVSSVGNTFLKLALPNGQADKTLEMSIQNGPCGDEFTALMHEQREKLEFCLQRSAEYLNWRYVNNPLANYEIVTARRHGKLIGYAVWTQAGEDALVVDLFGENNPAIVQTLLAEVVVRLRNSGVMTVSLWLNESHPWHSLFSEMGFGLRDSVPLMIIPSKTVARKIDPQLTGWYLMQGDRDS